jgi:hypothetical protein
VPAWVVRWLVNVALYLATTLTGALIVLVFYDFHGRDLDWDFAFYAWTFATLMLAPGGLAYLTLLELIPTGWSGLVRRALAVCLALLLLLLGTAVYGRRGGLFTSDPWGYVLLAVFGLLVRLRQPRVREVVG